MSGSGGCALRAGSNDVSGRRTRNAATVQQDGPSHSKLQHLQRARMQLDQHRHDSIRRLTNAAQRFAEQPPDHCARLHRVPSRVLNCISARLAAADFAGGTPRCHDWRGWCCPAASLSGRHQGQAPRRSRAPSKGVAAAHAFRVAPAPGAQSAEAFLAPLRWLLGRS